MAIRIFSKPFLAIAAVTAVASGVGTYAWREEHRPPILEVYVFSLKSGGAIFIRTAQDKRILINGGAGPEVIREITKILPFYSRRIDMIFSTGTEGKNISGLIDVLNRYKIDFAYVPSITLEDIGIATATDQINSTFMDTLKRSNIPVKEVIAGNNLVMDEKTFMRILFPASIDDFKYSNASGPEILFQVNFGSNSIVYMGSASNKVQKFVASSSTAVLGRTDVLIVTHSALPENLSPQLMNRIKPENLIFSKVVRQTTVKIKDKPVIDPLAYINDENRFNIKEKGTIKIVSDGSKINISEFK